VSKNRRCDYCGALFEPTTANQRFCARVHKEKARGRRARGLPERKPGSSAFCPWCSAELTGSADEEAGYCCADHRTWHLRCQCKESFYTAEAAKVMAEHRSVPAKGGDLWFYRCPGPGEPHWHLFDREKQRAKRRVA
jgi:hypothetical protein